ncbi:MULTISPECIES: PTS sugar transporter subunit IIA [Lactobacillus]|uniref:PTS sugar transporter subunit IIA n=1 Tax=Lactobacillus TaxID=1578 RepID=UPI000CDB2563|nr:MULTISPECIES: hypothetical protein [Lactobacillus]MCX8724650.1 hypothetical protein [Lactobacillus sp. B4007]
MFKIIIASHGCLAEAMKKSVKLFFPQENDLVTASIGEDGLVPFQAQLDKIFDNLKGQNVLFLVDLSYGTPFNEIVKRMSLLGKDSDILAGVSMATLIEAINLRNQKMEIKKVVPKLIEASQLQSYSDRLATVGNDDDE